MAVTGCGANNSSMSAKDELVYFLNEQLPEITDKEIEAMNSYNSYFENNKELDTEAFKKELSENIIPAYNEFMNELVSIEIQNDEVKELYDTYYTSMELQYEAINKVYEALTEGKDDYRDEAEELLQHSSEKYEEYNEMIKKLAAEYNISITN